MIHYIVFLFQMFLPIMIHYRWSELKDEEPYGSPILSKCMIPCDLLHVSIFVFARDGRQKGRTKILPNKTPFFFCNGSFFTWLQI